jgi:dTMP kinase
VFITFEGTEGSGKSTQIALLAGYLRASGFGVVMTREPGGTPLGDSLRELMLDSAEPLSGETEALLMTAARAEHVRRVIRPALAQGSTVLSDRFADSTLAYQGGGRGLPIDSLRAMQDLAVGPTVPDLTFLLDVPVEIGLRRRAAAGDANRIDRESLEFHERVAAWYRAEACSQPSRWRVIDATQPPGVVHTHIVECVRTARAEEPIT